VDSEGSLGRPEGHCKRKEDLKAILAEIATVTAGLKELDASVESATKQRKDEHAVSAGALAENGAAKELLEMARNRLNKFYNPALAAPAKAAPAEASLVQEVDADLVDRNAENEDADEAPSFVQVTAHSESDEDDASTSESDESNSDDQIVVIKHKKEESSGALRMITLLQEDLGKQILEIELEEKEGQKDYETFIQDSADKRAIDSKAVADKESTKAKIETELQKGKEKKAGEESSLSESQQELSELHGDCDWLIKTFDARKAAREDETDALTKARAVLAGADYS